MTDGDRQPVSLIGRSLPDSLRTRIFTIARGEARAYDAAEWRDSLVVVERGLLELEFRNGSRWTLERGAILCLAGLPLTALRNAGAEPLVVSAVNREGRQEIEAISFSATSRLNQREPNTTAKPTEQETTSMQSATSADGTAIAYDRFGDGPPLIMVAGAFNARSTTAPLAKALADRFTVLNPDRRGRGDSGDAEAYAVEREIEDLEALVAAAGGSAAVFGYSSGTCLSLRAAAAGVDFTKIVLYDPPYVVDGSRPLLPPDFTDQLRELIAEDRRGEAVELYQRVCIGIPEEMVVQMRDAPFRPGLEEIAHTLVYESEVVGDLSFPAAMVASIEQPTLVLNGEQSPPIMDSAAAMLVQTLPDARRSVLAGLGHDLAPEALAPLAAEFLADADRG